MADNGDHANNNTTPSPSSDAARARMEAVKSKDTKPEIQIRSILHRKGLRYRVDANPIKGLNRRADIIFRSARVAVFVDGCFWHGCPEHGTWPKANAEFWAAKIKRNKERDADTNRRLKEADWKVIRVWEHEDPEAAAKEIYRIVNERR
jgi:DNA mismatch endonuclease (patch repair protein)